MKVMIPWCLKHVKVCEPQYMLRYYNHIVCQHLQCPYSEIVEASCSTCTHLAHGISSEMKFNGIKTPMDYCDRGDDLFDGCIFYKPRK